MASGGVRHDFTEKDEINLGEDRVARIPLVDSAGVALASFAGWTAVRFYVYAELADDLATAALREAAALAVFSVADGEVDIGTAPNVDTTIAAAALADAGLTPGRYWYACWREDSGNTGRVAYGLFVVVP